MDIASVFDWFARDSVHAAGKSDDPRQRETLLKLALQWEAAAQQSRDEASPQQSYDEARSIVSAPLQRARYLGRQLSSDRKLWASPARIVRRSLARMVRSSG